MPTSKLLVIVKREYLSRVRTAGFWIGTVALPVVMAAWMVLPSLIMMKSRGELHLAVVDETGKVAPALQARIAAAERGSSTADEGADGTATEGAAGEGSAEGAVSTGSEAAAGGEAAQDDRRNRRLGASFHLEVLAPEADEAAQRTALDRRVLAEAEGGDELDAWLWIDAEGLANNEVEYHGATVSNILTLEALDDLVTEIVRAQRLSDSGYDVATIEHLVANIDLKRVRVTEEGGEQDVGVGQLALAIGLFTILYMAIMIYGNMLMHGVLEEKANRVVEVMAAATRPIELMAGKMLGICGAALTQIGIWVVSAAVLTAPGVIAGFASLPEGVRMPVLTPAIVGHFFALFLLGFVLYASFYALIGAAFNNPQEAQQLAGLAVVFIVVPWMVFMPVLNDPDSTLAVVTSMIPLFTPMIMMLRIAVKMPPVWQVVGAYALTIAFDVFMLWLCARVYRVGILMYGKRPSIKEIWKWARY
jgi:ABC-2 type transport system permease protein